MVQCMESWFFADKESIAEFFGQNFNRNALRQNPNIETITKDDLFRDLKSATCNTQKGEYRKGNHSFELLARIDPQKVLEASPYAERFIQCVRNHA